MTTLVINVILKTQIHLKDLSKPNIQSKSHRKDILLKSQVYMECSPIIDHVLGSKTSLNKKTEIISSIFSNHNGRKTRNLLPEKNWKIHRCVEIKQNDTEQPKSQRRNQKKN